MNLTGPMSLFFPWNLGVTPHLPVKNLPGPGHAIGKAPCPGELNCRVASSQTLAHNSIT